MVKDHILPIDQFRPFLLYFLLESHQLLAAEIRNYGRAQRTLSFYIESIILFAPLLLVTPGPSSPQRRGRPIMTPDQHSIKSAFAMSPKSLSRMEGSKHVDLT
ncbi:hypothetical protein EVAR_51081_1 [Eumeta japonica]|uniref:Uncharacterized protein n=1 Tax=Eumeta variegata TaxID=151549 RepID=A0A4C1XJX7_EUMVA|nr:hypothetical protein EVAR_51081_1 [Eumeta japonica]